MTNAWVDSDTKFKTRIFKRFRNWTKISLEKEEIYSYLYRL